MKTHVIVEFVGLFLLKLSEMLGLGLRCPGLGLALCGLVNIPGNYNTMHNVTHYHAQQS